MVSGKTSLISTAVAAICIIIYITAIAFGAARMIISTNDRRALAEKEFGDLADTASSAAILGFMSQDYQESLMDVIEGSQTLLGAIISGSDGQYGFERSAGTVINWVGDSPRFKSGLGLQKDPYHRVIRINGQRNGTIQAQYTVIDYRLFLDVLRRTLTMVLAALALALLTLLIEILMKNKPAAEGAAGSGAHGVKAFREGLPGEEAAEEPKMKITPARAPLQGTGEVETDDGGTEKKAAAPGGNKPEGLYSPRSNVGWEAYTADRLASELHRCAATEQDLVLVNIEQSGGASLKSEMETANPPMNQSMNNSLYMELADETVKFFNLRDLIFEKGGQGFAVILPGVNLEQGIEKSEEFCRRVQKRFPGILAGLRIGLSSRSGRLVEAGRLMLESSEALNRAVKDQASPVVAFKSDPEKYREFIARR